MQSQAADLYRSAHHDQETSASAAAASLWTLWREAVGAVAAWLEGKEPGKVAPGPAGSGFAEAERGAPPALETAPRKGPVTPAEERQKRRIRGRAQRVWTRADGFTLSGPRMG